MPVAAALIGFANAKYEAELDARDVDFLATREFDAALERREILADLSTRDLVDALSDRLSSRSDYICKYCDAVFTDKEKWKAHESRKHLSPASQAGRRAGRRV
ncbi:hypothetical protein D9611_012337 [Ephemerocybe angulata]|uniref:C2H2-type domain-containing protein n=1 Tax=Ephemerocybe angulata TaxID=980116 RepID=A0A8H5CGA7_9AGAR|nr:hypothetical protein D9611_012337 [Tulosesus angulatus]